MQLNEKPLEILPALNGHLILYPDRLVIRKADWFSNLFHHYDADVQTIRLHEIADIILYSPRLFMSGALRIVVAGNPKANVLLIYRVRDHRTALRIKETVEDLASRMHVHDFVKEHF